MIWIQCQKKYYEGLIFEGLSLLSVRFYFRHLIVNSEKVTLKSSGSHRPSNCVTNPTNFQTQMLFTILLAPMLLVIHYLFRAFSSLSLLQKCQNDQSYLQSELESCQIICTAYCAVICTANLYRPAKTYTKLPEQSTLTVNLCSELSVPVQQPVKKKRCRKRPKWVYYHETKVLSNVQHLIFQPQAAYNLGIEHRRSNEDNISAGGNCMQRKIENTISFGRKEVKIQVKCSHISQGQSTQLSVLLMCIVAQDISSAPFTTFALTRLARYLSRFFSKLDMKPHITVQCLVNKNQINHIITYCNQMMVKNRI